MKNSRENSTSVVAKFRWHWASEIQFSWRTRVILRATTKGLTHDHFRKLEVTGISLDEGTYKKLKQTMSHRTLSWSLLWLCCPLLFHFSEWDTNAKSLFYCGRNVSKKLVLSASCINDSNLIAVNPRTASVSWKNFLEQRTAGATSPNEFPANWKISSKLPED